MILTEGPVFNCRNCSDTFEVKKQPTKFSPILLSICCSLFLSTEARSGEIDDLGSEAFNITAPVDSFWNSKVRSKYMGSHSVSCISRKGNTYCSLKNMGVDCSEKYGSLVFDESDTNTGNLEILVLKRLTGEIKFKFLFGRDWIFCDGKFSIFTSPKKITESIKASMTSNEFDRYSCSGISTLMGSTKIEYKLRKIKNAAQLCPNIPF